MSDHDALLRELEAARRTVAVLKERVASLQDGAHSSFQRQLAAAQSRERESLRRQELIALRAVELARHAEHLEAEVALRTAAMHRILDNVKFGFLVADAGLVVQPGCTVSCRALFGVERVEGALFTELLRLDKLRAANFRICAEQVFEDILPEEVSLAQMRTDFPVGGRTLRAEGSVVRDASGVVEGILFTISDISALLAAQRESAQNQILVNILRNRASFLVFVDDTQALLLSSFQALAARDTPTLQRAVHTIKGNCAAYDLTDLVELIHEIEEQGIDDQGLRRIEVAFASFLQEQRAILGVSLDGACEDRFEVSAEQVSSLRRIASALDSNDLKVWAASVTQRAASVLLGPIELFTERLAQRLGKPARLVLVGGDTLLEETMRPVMQTLVHLIRNAIDHGVEPPDRRGDKPAQALLSLEVCATPSCYRIEFHDDGAGIDTERVVAIAVQRGLLSAQRAASLGPEERIEAIFLDGVSSAVETSDVSGRGVGLSAVRSVVNAAGGEIRVRSSGGAGTTFTIEIPRAYPAPRPRPTSARSHRLQ